MVDLEKIATEQLRRELQRREAEEQAAQAQARERHRELIRQNVDALLNLIPEHGRTSCSDTKISNYGRCTRCTLLTIKEDNIVYSDVERLDIHLIMNQEF